MKLKITAANETVQIVYVDAYKFESGFLVLSNPRTAEDKAPEHDGILISCSEIKLMLINK